MLNSITLIGRVGQNPTVKVISDATQVSNFSVAYTEKYKDQPQTTWFNVQAWNGLSKIVQDQVKKGDLVTVIGKLTSREAEGKTYWTLTAERVIV
jgi:single-strand DNA-binding protein